MAFLRRCHRHNILPAFVSKVCGDKNVDELKTRNAAIDATVALIEDVACGGEIMKCISGDRAGKLGQSFEFQFVLGNPGLRSLPPRTPQNRGIAERAFQ